MRSWPLQLLIQRRCPKGQRERLPWLSVMRLVSLASTWVLTFLQPKFLWKRWFGVGVCAHACVCTCVCVCACPNAFSGKNTYLADFFFFPLRTNDGHSVGPLPWQIGKNVVSLLPLSQLNALIVSVLIRETLQIMNTILLSGFSFSLVKKFSNSVLPQHMDTFARNLLNHVLSLPCS